MPRFLHCAVLLLVAGTLVGQTKPEKKDTPEAAQNQQQPVAPDDMVIVISGACETAPLQFAVRDCIRGVTRQEFEGLIAATNPNATPEYRKKLAETLGRIIILSNEAKKRGMTKDPDIQQVLHFAELQELANLLVSRELKSEPAPTDADIEAFYKSHLADIETSELLRITVPPKGATRAESDERYAEDIRARCSSGEDPEKLQTEADQRAGKDVLPPSDLKNQRRTTFPAAEQSVFDLKKGDCALVSPDTMRFDVYKMVGVTTPPLNDVRSQIAKAIEENRTKVDLQQVSKQNVISLNQKYFSGAPSGPRPSLEASPK